MGRCLAFCVLLAVNGPGTWAAEKGSPAYASLSGIWKGSYSVFQRGRCPVGRAGRLDAQVRLELTVDVDGAFEAKVTSIRYVRDPSHLDAVAQFPAEGDPGFGRFKTDLTFVLKVPRRSSCRGVVRQFEVVYSGNVSEKKGKQRMDMRAPVEPCPEFDHCVFENVLSLAKE